ncbi:hypothetical protein Pla52o_23920 [Novipirellula galeiformis]|uniref:Uncharacterized protein n=1 Tax=Novipirellula galeiformis TaxID=2528004 RepID=A0A5C6CDC6_9BACT|nr:hypothetical protein [Novipirellula galeiformis]TWU22863.1 hypothetical protein Pla52o_23920 [Novipirellula galeiformis]
MTVVRWDRVPSEFHYLRDAVEACGETRVTLFDPTVRRHVPLIETASEEQLDFIRSAKDQVERREDRLQIEKWCENPAQKRPSVRTAIWHIQGMLFLFDQLDGHQLEVFDEDFDDD